MRTGLKERLPQVTQDENEISPKDIREVARLRYCEKGEKGQALNFV